MAKIDTSRWKEFRIGDLFDIHPTNAYKLTNHELMSDYGKNKVVVNSSYNNGIGGYSEFDCTEKGGIITFSDTTTADAVFYQKDPFIGYPHVQGMYPKEYKDKWLEHSLQFFVTVFKSKAGNKNYDYVNKFTRASVAEMTVVLPVDKSGTPDFEYMESYIQNLEKKIKEALSALTTKRDAQRKIDTSRWKEFRLGDLFDVRSSNRVISANNTIIDDIQTQETHPYVTRSTKNNGIRGYIKGKNHDLNEGNCLTFAQDTFIAFYQEQDFYTGNNVKILTPKMNEFTEKIGLYITEIINKQCESLSWGANSDMNYIKSISLCLPVDKSGVPDFDYMDEYITSIETASKKELENLLLAINR